MVALGAAICIWAQLRLRIGQSQDWAGGRYGDWPPVQKGYGANLEYIPGNGGRPGGHQGKKEVLA